MFGPEYYNSGLSVDERINIKAEADRAKPSHLPQMTRPAHEDSVLTAEDEFQANLFKGSVEIKPTRAKGLDELMAKFGQKEQGSEFESEVIVYEA